MNPPHGATSWVEVSLDALRENFARVAELAGVPVCAVVKANAYGHGLVPVARTFAEAGARMLGVTRWEEAREIRAGGVTAPVVVLTPVAPEIVAEAVRDDVALTIASTADIDALGAGAREAGRPARAHLKIDTGMGRLGVTPAEAPAIAQRLSDDEHIAIEGVWTHFAAAGTPSARAQLERFEAVRASLGKHAARAIVHAANSAATLALPAARYDMVRVGTLLYGMQPPNVSLPRGLRDAFTWHARVLSIRTLSTGASVGYGSEWTARRPTRIATIGVGYADGFGLEPSARTETFAHAARAAARVGLIAARRRPSPRAVLIGGRRAPVVGRISMQQASIVVDAFPNLQVGNVVEIGSRRLLVSPQIHRVYR